MTIFVTTFGFNFQKKFDRFGIDFALIALYEWESVYEMRARFHTYRINDRGRHHRHHCRNRHPEFVALADGGKRNRCNRRM